MTGRELKALVAALPESADDLQVWIQASCEEGATNIHSIWVDNANFCGLDGDEVGDEYKYFNDDDEEPQVTLDEIPAEYTLKVEEEDGTICAYKDIIIITDRNGEDAISYSKRGFYKDLEKKRKKAEKAILAAQEKAQLEQDPELVALTELQESLKKKYPNALGS